MFWVHQAMDDIISTRKDKLKDVTWKEIIFAGMDSFEVNGTDKEKEKIVFGPGLCKKEWVSKGLGKQWNSMMDEIDCLKDEIKKSSKILSSVDKLKMRIEELERSR